MVLGLIVSNLAIAKKTEISFEKNLVLITGETGTGKTIIMNALGIVCGANVGTDVIRTGEDSSTVEASFTVSDSKRTLEVLENKSLYDGEDVVVIARTISKTRGKSLVNGHLVSLRELSEIGKTLVDMHGQHEIQSLLDPSTHLKFIDKFGHREISAVKDKVVEEIRRYNEVKRLKEELIQQDEKYREEIDFINFEIQEIEEARLDPEEEHALTEEEKILSNVKELAEISTMSESILNSEESSLIKAVSQLKALLSKGSQLTEKLSSVKEQVENVEIECKEILWSLSSFTQSLVYDPARFEFIQERLNLLSKLKLKYKKTIPELIEYLDDLKKQVSSFNSLRDQIESLQKEEDSLIERIKSDVPILSNLRKEYARELTLKIEEQLKDLAMENANFTVSFNEIEDDRGIEINGKKVRLLKDGVDVCEFLISANPGEEFKPLVQIASGGELSRVMLAIKYVLAQVDEIPVLAFDEVDAGIGGKTAEKIAEKLLEISKYRQVICITHLPQIAALPGEHFVVEKQVRDSETFLEVKKLNEFERINEIAKMISGSNITETTINQAKELLWRWK